MQYNFKCLSIGNKPWLRSFCLSELLVITSFYSIFFITTDFVLFSFGNFCFFHSALEEKSKEIMEDGSKISVLRLVVDYFVMARGLLDFSLITSNIALLSHPEDLDAE